jgi:hypothetical protein
MDKERQLIAAVLEEFVHSGLIEYSKALDSYRVTPGCGQLVEAYLDGTRSLEEIKAHGAVIMN